jgi:LuxR family maltose regulon positive regulatory protein
MQWLRPDPCSLEVPAPVLIYTLGRFELLINGAVLQFEGRGPRKPLELLTILVAFGPHGAGVGPVTDLLWPDADGFDGYRALITTLHRLRQLLLRRQAIHFGAGRLWLDATVCAVDLWRFEQLLAAARDRQAVQRALALYRGPFLTGDDSACAVGVRARLEESIARATRRHWMRGAEQGERYAAQAI